MPRIYTTEIPDSQCIGDSLNTINKNYESLDNTVQSLSSYDNTLLQATNVNNNNLTAKNDLTVENVLKVNTIQSKTGTNLFVNGYPRQPGQIIEYLSSPCDGSSVQVGSGTYTFQNVTTAQASVTTYTDVNGSFINYRPPTGASRIIYRFNFAAYWADEHAISHFKFFIDSNEVLFARHNRSGRYPEDKYSFEWTIAIGGTPNINTGRLADWTTFRQLKMQWRSYGVSNERALHGTNYWDGASSNQFSIPTLTIIAIA